MDQEHKANRRVRRGSKLTPPLPDLAHWLNRPRIIDKMQRQLASQRLLVLEAQPGQGKTVAAVQFFHRLELQPLWYRIDPDDADPQRLWNILAALLHEHFPDNALAPAQSPPTSELERLLYQIELANDRTLYLVFDGLEALVERNESSALLAYLIANAPNNLRILLLGRQLPSNLAQIAANDAAAWLRNEELAFNEEEIRELYQQVLQLDYPRRSASTIHRLSQGWPMSVSCLIDSIRSVGEHALEEPLDNWPPLRKALIELDEYFRLRVLNRVSPIQQRMLATMAWLDPAQSQQLAAALQLDNATGELQKLLAANLFVSRSGDHSDRYRLHPLFRGFLKRNSDVLLGPEELRLALGRAAGCARDQGLIEEAARHAWTGGDLSLADALVRKHHELLLSTDLLGLLGQTGLSLTQSQIRSHPWLALLLGSNALELDPGRSLPLMQAIQQAFADAGDRCGELAALARLLVGECLSDGCLSTISPLMSRLQTLLHAHTEPLSPSLALLVSLASASVQLFTHGTSLRAQAMADRALHLAQQLGAINQEIKLRLIRGSAYILLGDFDCAGIEVEHLHRYLTNPALTDLNRLLIRTYFCNLLNCLGAYESFTRHAGKLERDDQRGLLHRSLFGPLLQRWRADQALARGDIAGMLKHADAGLALGFSAFSPHLRSQLLLYRAYAHAAQGKAEQARDAAEESARLREQAGGSHYLLQSRVLLGRTYALLGDVERARATLDAAIQEAPEIGAPFPLAGAYAHRAWLHLSAQREDLAVADAEAFLTIMHTRGYRTCYGWCPEVIQPVLELAQRHGLLSGYPRTLARQGLGVDIDEHGVSRPLLRLKTLGGFEMWQHGRLLLDSRDLTPRPQQYVATLAAAPGGELPRDALQETMWPDGGQSTSKLYALRNRIKNVVAAKHPDVDIESYLVLRGSLARLENVEIDAHQFVEHVQRGIQHTRNNRLWHADNAFYEAQLLWHGSYFPTAPETDLIRDYRAELSRLDHQRVTLWTESLIAAGDIGEAIEVLRGHFELDPTDTEVAERLHKLYILRGSPVAAAKVLRRHRSALEQEGYPAEEIECALDAMLARLGVDSRSPSPLAG